MQRIKRFFKSRKSELLSLSGDEKICGLVLISIFTPYIITGLVTLGAVAYALARPAIRHTVLHAHGMRWFFLLLIPLLLAPLFHWFPIGIGGGMLMALILLFSVYLSCFMTRRLFELLLDWAVMLSFPCAVYSYIEQMIHWGEETRHRSVSVFLNANYLGCMVEFLILVCVYKLLQGRKNPRFWLYFTAVPVNLTALYFADSFSAWAAIFVSVFVLLLLNKKYHITVPWMAAVAAGLVAVFTVPGLLPRLAAFPQTLSRRMEIWVTGLEGFLQYPVFGQGIFTYYRVSEELGRYQQLHSHNILLDSLLCLGVFGTVCLFGFFISRYRKKALPVPPNPDNAPVNRLFWAAAIAITVHGLTDFPILWIQTGLFALFLFSGRQAGEALGSDSDKQSHLLQA